MPWHNSTSSPLSLNSHGVYVSQLGEKFPGGFVSHRDFSFSPTQREENHQQGPLTVSPPGDVYPRVAYSGPRHQEEEKRKEEKAEEENNKELSSSVNQPGQSAASRTEDLYSSLETVERSDDADVIEPITLYPHLDIENIKTVNLLDSQQPQVRKLS